ncbi:Smr/MutS family protein [Sinisalibacter aestuarii]|uniref:DNA mismatch repair protein MutS n=1 Tax=Sinisalibacter aestuarii TaxID=2949426 RepID=A0ABQ5LPU5_9RHOB|nr:Smr/MutS family protein [Sinisalibacter aestuarii]GKY86440.1 DNA mismatch repair protein MutS [Sinisalibacter aestuarii]
MPRRKPRNLRPEEAELWKKVIEKADPLHPKRLPGVETSVLAQPKSPKVPVPRFRLGETAKPAPPLHDLAPGISDHLANQPLSMDRKRFTKLKKGRITPDARIDLHGLTIAQAHPALTGFILDAVAQGHRLVLVITGKGKSKPDHGPIPERHGVLRHQVPHWLHTPPLKPHILQVAEAHIRHGGQGAYYVYLRRAR